MHFIVSSSAAGKWGHCSPSLLLEAQYPDVEDPEAADGTASHWVVEQVLKSYQADAGLRMPRDLVGARAPNGIVIDDHMADGAALMINDVLKVTNRHGALRNMMVERTGTAPNLIHPLQGGTLDVAVVILRDDEKVIYLYDYKYGHMVVEAELNFQLICYYAQLFEALDLTGLDDQEITVVFKVVQPRAMHRDGPVREWRCKASDLRAHVNHLSRMAHEAINGGGLCNPGKWCRTCKAASDCEAVADAASWAMTLSKSPSLAELTPDDQAYELQLLREAQEFLKARINARESAMAAAIESGEHIPGYTLAQSFGREKVADEHRDTVIGIGKMFNVDVTKTVLLTPNQIEAAGVDRAVIEPYTIKPSGGKRLVECETTNAFRAFNKKGSQ